MRFVYILILHTDVILDIIGVYTTLELANEAKIKCMAIHFPNGSSYIDALHILEWPVIA